MDHIQNLFQELYGNSNDRKIDLVMAHITEDVKWTNRMEGGYIYGHDDLKQYWERQFAILSSKLTPLEIHFENNLVKVKARQAIHDLSGT